MNQYHNFWKLGSNFILYSLVQIKNGDIHSHCHRSRTLYSHPTTSAWITLWNQRYGIDVLYDSRAREAMRTAGPRDYSPEDHLMHGCSPNAPRRRSLLCLPVRPSDSSWMRDLTTKHYRHALFFAENDHGQTSGHELGHGGRLPTWTSCRDSSFRTCDTLFYGQPF